MTLEGFELPDGWDYETNGHYGTVLHAPGTRGGYCTVNFEARAYRLGSVVVRRAYTDKIYKGRGWRAALVRDAVRRLQNAIEGRS